MHITWIVIVDNLFGKYHLLNLVTMYYLAQYCIKSTHIVRISPPTVFKIGRFSFGDNCTVTKYVHIFAF